MSSKLTRWIGLAGLLVALPAAADDVRYVQENGVTYRETTRVERQPVVETVVEQREQTVYTPRVTTEMRESVRTVYVPVVEYRYEPRVHNWWNPFAPAHVAYHQIPSTRWEPRTEVVRTPVTYHELIPETRVVEKPVRKLGFADQKRIERVAVTPVPMTPTSSAATVARRPVGSVGVITNEPPRYGAATVLR